MGRDVSKESWPDTLGEVRVAEEQARVKFAPLIEKLHTIELGVLGSLAADEMKLRRAQIEALKASPLPGFQPGQRIGR